MNIKNNDFFPTGNLRSVVNYQWTGEIHRMEIKEVKTYSLNSDQAKTSYSVSILDCYGFEQSYWKRTMTIEGANVMLCQLPRNVTLRCEGTVSIRKGRTYFNVDRIVYPDGTPFAYRYAAIAGESENLTTIGGD